MNLHDAATKIKRETGIEYLNTPDVKRRSTKAEYKFFFLNTTLRYNDKEQLYEFKMLDTKDNELYNETDKDIKSITDTIINLFTFVKNNEKLGDFNWVSYLINELLEEIGVEAQYKGINNKKYTWEIPSKGLCIYVSILSGFELSNLGSDNAVKFMCQTFNMDMFKQSLQSKIR